MSNSNEGFNEKLKETANMNEEELDEYFFEKSKEILSEYKLIYQKLQYGPNRGQYFVYLPMENDLSQKYLNGNGCNYAINGTGNDKEVAFRIMSRTLADCMNTLYKKGKIMIGENSVFNSLVASHSMNIIKPKRGGKYSQAEWSDIRSFFYEMFNSPPINEKKTKIIEWRTNLIQSIGFDFFKKIFLTSSRFASITDAESNPHNFRSSYPLNSLEIYLSHKINHSNNGVLCKYGNCLFDDVTTRTFENVFQNYQEAMSYCNTMIDKELEILSNRDLYDGSISLELWNKKYSNTNIGSELKAEILRTSYGLHIEKDHDYENAIANYLKNPGVKKEQINPGRSRETMEDVVWAFEPKDYKSFTKGMRFIMINNNGLTVISSLGSLPIGILESKYELAKSWTNSFISNVNFKFTHFRDLHYYKEQKDLFSKLKTLLEKNNDYVPLEKDLLAEILEPTKNKENTILLKEGKLRPWFFKSPMLLGKEIEILMPNGEKRKGQFAVVELNNIIASHNHISFSSSKDYPTNEKFENINDRNYHDDPNAQAKVIDVAQNLEPSILLSTSRTPAGTPIISIDGFVVSGNNRTMSLKLASHKFPERYEAYKKMLLDECEAFGISRTDLTSSLMGEKILDKRNTSKPFQLQSENDLIKIENPVLVRFDYDFPTYNTLEISKYNKETKKSERPLDKAIKLSSILQSNIKLRDSICLMVGEHETLSEFYSVAKDQRQLINILVEGNLLTTQEKAAYLGDSGFNSAGKDLVEMILSSIVLDRDSLIASDTEGVKRLRGIIITSLPVLVRNASLPKGSLKETINRSIVLEKSIQTSGLSFGDYISQEALFEEKPERNVLIMNRLLVSGRNNFKKAIDSYNDSVSDNQGENLFGEKPELNEIFFVHIEKRIDPKELSLINKFYPLKNKSADSDAQPSFFFEDHTSDRFLNEIRKFTFFDEFSRRYSELDLWIDVTDSAQLGIIRVADIIPMPGNDESKPINESFFKGLLDHIKSGKGMTPIVVERAHTGYYLREGLFRLLAYKELAKEFIPALVYQNHVLSAKRDFANPDQLTIEDFLDITLDNLFRNARDKQTHSPDKKTYIGSYEGFKKVIPNVMIPISVREPWCCRDVYVTDLMKEFKKGKFPDLKSLTNKDLPNLSPSQMFELLQLSHPTEYKIKIDRMDLLLEWEKRGKTIFEKLGFPTDINYPYVNVNTGYRSVYTLGHNINEERENVQWWACAQNNLPMGDLERGIEILDREINTLNEVQQTLIDPKTKKVKSRNKDLYNQNAFEINSYERGKLVISEYLKRSESDKSIKEKEAEAQIMIVNLLKKKLSLEKKKQK